MKEWEKGWLAGIYDADGSIGMGRNMTRRSSPYPIYSAQIQLSSTSESMIEKTVNLLKELGISKKPTIQYRNRTGYIGKEFYINVSRHRDVRDVLNLLMPYLTVKRPQAEIVLAFVERRIAVNWPARKSNHEWGKTSFTKEDEEAWRSLAAHNKKRPRDLSKSS